MDRLAAGAGRGWQAREAREGQLPSVAIKCGEGWRALVCGMLLAEADKHMHTQSACSLQGHFARPAAHLPTGATIQHAETTRLMHSLWHTAAATDQTSAKPAAQSPCIPTSDGRRRSQAVTQAVPKPSMPR